MIPFTNVAGRGNVVFNFQRDPIGDLRGCGRGYHEAARRLANRFAEREGPDYEGYPILYLYRHALELYLKAVVYKGAGLLGLTGKGRPDTTALFKCHKLISLVPAVRAIFAEMDWTFTGLASIRLLTLNLVG